MKSREIPPTDVKDKGKRPPYTLRRLGAGVLLAGIVGGVTTGISSIEKSSQPQSVASVPKTKINEALSFHNVPILKGESLILFPGTNLRSNPEFSRGPDGSVDYANVIYQVENGQRIKVNQPYEIVDGNGNVWLGGYLSINNDPQKFYVDVTAISSEQQGNKSVEFISYGQSFPGYPGESVPETIK